MKNLANYNSEENIGSIHWYRTLVSQLNRNLEDMEKPEFEKYHKVWLKTSRNIVKDLIEWSAQGNTELFKSKENIQNDNR